VTADSPSLDHRDVPGGRLDARWLQAPASIRLVDQFYDGRTLSRLLLRKMLRRLRGRPAPLRPIVSYHGLAVFDREDLDGGGLWFGVDYPRVLLELGIGKCSRIFEMCAGPGYIGYYLLALGFCDHLALADMNPGAVEAAECTRKFNGLEERVAIYMSDVLDAVPERERWDLVVGNPPHFLESDAVNELRARDADWSVHRRFYDRVGRYMSPGGLVVLVENEAGSEPAVFEPMIRAAGGQVVATIPGRDALGRPNGFYFLASRW
jgi:predicted RNA methylase